MSPKDRIAIIGVGYVGLPVAVAFARAGHELQAYDASHQRIGELQGGDDRTGQFSAEDLALLKGCLTTDPATLAHADVFIVLTQTTVSDSVPDTSAVENGLGVAARYIQRGSLVVVSSTVPVGFTDERARPILEEASGMIAGVDFGLAYAPERVDPGNPAFPYSKVHKVVSGVDSASLERVARLYSALGLAGIVIAPSIKTAEAARILENTQRDANIALMNEAAAIFALHGVDMGDVLAVARTKWNFLNFYPGLVGGHCVNVHTHFLAHAASQVDFNPVLASTIRQSNDLVPDRIVRACTEQLMSHETRLPATVSVFGLTYKENVPDMRGTLVKPIVSGLLRHGCQVQVTDPLARPEDVALTLGLAAKSEGALAPADAIILAVPHQKYRQQGWELVQRHLKASAKIVIDVRGILDRTKAPPGVIPWRL
jgi:UDP-N-acetyl-D-galactosamine dehydrogenase